MILHFSNPLHFRRQSNFKPHPLVHFLSLIASSPIFRPHLLCCGRFNLNEHDHHHHHHHRHHHHHNIIIIINIIIIYSPCFSLIYFAEKDSLSKWSFTESFWWDYFCSGSFSQTISLSLSSLLSLLSNCNCNCGKISNASLGIMTLLFVFYVFHTNMNDKIFRRTKYSLKWFETVCNWIFHLFFCTFFLQYFGISNSQYSTSNT